MLYTEVLRYLNFAFVAAFVLEAALKFYVLRKVIGSLFYSSSMTLNILGHLSHSGDLLLWVGVRRRTLTSSSQDLLALS